MPRRLTLLAASLMGLTVSHVALAELYISPTLRNTVSYNTSAPAPQIAPVTQVAPVIQATPPAIAQAAAKPVAAPPAATINGNSTVHGAFEMKAEQKKGSLFGKNVPLFVALENLVPNSKAWTIVFQPGTENMAVSWKDAASWRDAVVQISKSNQLIIAINEPAKRISVARTAEMAKRLAQPGQDVWQLNTELSLRGNLEAWAKKAGWKVDWGTTQIDYPVDHSATLVGNFAGRGGVVDRVLNATVAREVPLTAKFYRGNNVVVIQEDGYKPEAPVTPVIDNEAY
jgi:hypothetical protein